MSLNKEDKLLQMYRDGRITKEEFIELISDEDIKTNEQQETHAVKIDFVESLTKQLVDEFMRGLSEDFDDDENTDLNKILDYMHVNNWRYFYKTNGEQNNESDLRKAITDNTKSAVEQCLSFYKRHNLTQGTTDDVDPNDGFYSTCYSAGFNVSVYLDKNRNGEITINGQLMFVPVSVDADDIKFDNKSYLKH